MSQGSVQILTAATTAAAGSAHQPRQRIRTFQATGATSAGAGAASIDIEGSNVPTPSVDGDWVTIMTIDLTLGTTKVGGGGVSDAPWLHVRANVKSISGTNASVDAYMGC